MLERMGTTDGEVLSPRETNKQHPSIKRKIDGEGWGGLEEETGRRGSAPAFPEGPKPECESMGGEREADLEDGCGDDNWGRHSTGGEASSLAANLR